MKRVLIYILPIFIFLACSKVGDNNITIPASNDYAQGFAVAEFDNYKVVEVRNPWDTLKILQRYILVPKGCELPDKIPHGTIIRTPISRAVVYASLHCGMIKELRKSEAIAGICDVHYNADSTLKNRVKRGEIADLGSSFLPDIEKIISVSPEIIILSPYKDRDEDKLSQLGIPIVEMADYMESVPLARTEWLKFISMLFDCEEVADSIFETTKKEYLRLSEIGRSVTHKPTLFCELKTGGVWYQPGGESYMAQLYRDAGIDYLWSDNSNKGSISLSFEEVFSRASNADLWFIKYADESDKTLKSLANEYALYDKFKPYKNKSVWGVNALKVPFYEEMPLYPHYVLRDLMIVAHPEMFDKSETMRYFKKLRNE
ncbi:MAG: ABC transporter substrate-binding protein [Bacteroidaceae bacterium]|nr:ABC transporter substrate-binding protein [Bacteroidaceae bacterium]